jgi:hypothetical protein
MPAFLADIPGMNTEKHIPCQTASLLRTRPKKMSLPLKCCLAEACDEGLFSGLPACWASFPQAGGTFGRARCLHSIAHFSAVKAACAFNLSWQDICK